MHQQNDVIHVLGKLTVPVDTIGNSRNMTYISLEAGLELVCSENTEEERDSKFRDAWKKVETEINSKIEEIVPSLLGTAEKAKEV